MKLGVFLICVSVTVLAIGFVEWIAKKVRNQDVTMIGVGIVSIDRKAV